MQEIRNSDGRLVAKLDKHAETIIIKTKSNITKIIRKPDGAYQVYNIKIAPQSKLA